MIKKIAFLFFLSAGLAVGVTQIGTSDIANLAVTNAKIAASTIDLTTKVTNALPFANGGTSQTTAQAAFDALAPCQTQGDIAYYNGSHWVCLATSTDGNVLVTHGAGANPTWVTNTCAVLTKTSSYPIQASDFSAGGCLMIRANCSSLCTITATAASGTGRWLYVKSVNTGEVDIAATVDGDSSGVKIIQQYIGVGINDIGGTEWSLF